MGACFEAFVPCGDRSMSYTAVHRVRTYLMRMFGKETADRYTAVMADMRTAKTESELNDAERRFDGMMDGLTGEHAFGVRSFVDHSDCDGDFGTEECEYIAKAFDALLDTDIVQDGDDRELIEELAEVFRDAGDRDGIVCIH